MPSPRRSLLGGRNRAPLDKNAVRRVANIFRGLEPDVVTRYDETHSTVFHVVNEGGEEFGEVIFGPDIYPGHSVVDANAALGTTAAAAHELTHFHRWRDNQALNAPEHEYLDEALTSLQAIQRYGNKMTETDVRQLVADAIARIHLYIDELASASAPQALEPEE